MHGHAFRARSAENVVAEFEYIAENFSDVKEVVIEDDTFTANKAGVGNLPTIGREEVVQATEMVV